MIRETLYIVAPNHPRSVQTPLTATNGATARRALSSLTLDDFSSISLLPATNWTRNGEILTPNASEHSYVLQIRREFFISYVASLLMRSFRGVQAFHFLRHLRTN